MKTNYILCFTCLVIVTSYQTRVASAQDNNITTGGWVGLLYQGNNQAGTAGRPGFDAHPWYFYIQGEPVEDWKIFAELEAEHVFTTGKSPAGKLIQERLYLEKNFSTANNVRGGKFFIPMGYWYSLHWHFLTETIGRPYSFNNKYIPRLQVGAQYFGRLFFGENTDIQYFAWLTNGPDLLGTNKRSVSKAGYGGSAFLEHSFNDDISLGVTAGYHQQQINDEQDLPETQRNMVLGSEFKSELMDIRGEYYRHIRLDESGKEMDDFHTYYVATTLRVLAPVGITNMGLTYRLDKGRDEKHTSKVADGGSRSATSHSMGAIWRPHAKILFKAEYVMHQFEDLAAPSFNEWKAFWAIKY